MSHLIEKHEKLVLTDEKNEEYGIKIGVDYLILPIELNTQENEQLFEDIKNMDYEIRKIDSDYIDWCEYRKIRSSVLEEVKKRYNKKNKKIF